jgi:hypothetical protein
LETILLTKEKEKKCLFCSTGKKCNWKCPYAMIPGFAVYDQDNIGGYGGASGSVTDIFMHPQH